MGLRLRHVGSVVVRLALLLSLLPTSPKRTADLEDRTQWLQLNDEEEDCVDAIALTRRVESMLPNGAPSGLEVTLDAGDEPRFELGLDGQQRYERSFSALPEECEDRTEALAVAIAIAIENLLEEESSGNVGLPEPIPSPEEPAPDEDRPASGPAKGTARNDKDSAAQSGRVAPSPRRRRKRTWSVRPFVGVGGLFGVLPRPAFVPELGADLVTHRYSFGLSLIVAPQVRSPLESGRVTSRLFGATLSGCREAILNLVGFSGCLRILAGDMIASATGLPGSGTIADSWWIAGGAGAAVRLPASGPVGIQVGFDGFLNALRPGVRVDVVGGDDRQDNAPVLGYRGSTHFFFLFH